MKKLARWFGAALLAVAFLWCGALLGDRYNLSHKLIRLHVVGASDSEADQRIKLQVRDGVMQYLKENMQSGLRPEQAKEWIQERLPELEKTADRVLRRVGVDADVTVSLVREAFPERAYDTFSLPSGVYDSLRITLGAGEGQNWWCVVFPSLCLPATTEGFEVAAAGAGFPDSLTGTLSRESGYEIRFFLLDWLGKIENFLFRK